MEASAARTPARRGPATGPLGARLLRVASDDRLVAAVRQGSEPAFEVVYDRHHRGILAFCRHMLGSREEAEDAVQHTFMAAYHDLVGSDKPIQLRAWLYAIARNRCLSVLRARRDRPTDELEDIPTEGLTSEVQRRQDLRDMLRDLAELPEDQRAALVLAEIGDLPHDEIAAVIGCPKDKVKALVFQARSSLHSSREARETSCEEIRELLSTLSGGSLRRSTLKRHLKDCPGCQAFQAEVRRQRAAMALVLPVIPTAGLKSSALAAAFSGKAAATGAGVAAATATGAVATGTGATAAGGIATGASALAAKALVVVAVAGGGVAGVSTIASSDKPVRSGESSGGGSGGSGPAGVPAAVPAPASEGAERGGKDESEHARKARRRGHDDRGKEFAKTRGKGRKRGLLGTQPGHDDARDAGKSATAGSNGTAKGKGKRPARRPRPAVPPRKAKRPVPRTAPAPRPTPAPRSAPAPTPEPTPAATAEPVPTPAPADPGGGKGNPGRD